MVLKSKTKKKIAISAVSIAIVAAALICIYHFFFSTAAIKGEKLMGDTPRQIQLIPLKFIKMTAVQLPVMQFSAFCVKSPIPHTLAIFIGKIIPTAQRLNGLTMIQS